MIASWVLTQRLRVSVGSLREALLKLGRYEIVRELGKGDGHRLSCEGPGIGRLVA